MKRIVQFTTLITILMSLVWSVVAFASESNTVTEDEAYNVAINFIMGNIEAE